MFAPMQPLAAIEQKFTDELAGLYPASETRHILRMLLEARLGWTARDYLLRRENPLPEVDTQWLNNALQALKGAMPVQYVVGYAWFMNLKLSVNESVLIPRPETEELVHLIIRHHQSDVGRPLRIIDIGTGSGCIAIALKKALPAASVYALDVSADALRVAAQNAQTHSADIKFINADILEWDTVFQEEQRFDIVVSNPPYIAGTEREAMHANVLNHEPHLALFVEGKAPLLFYQHIAAFALSHLDDPGYLYFEINRNYGVQLKDFLQKKGFAQATLYQDMQGADRMIQASTII
jgi:protein-(glutamine-N5) methyltransferase, release factor-specific